MKLWIIYLHFQYSYKYFLHRSTANQFIPREDTGPHTVFISNNNTRYQYEPLWSSRFLYLCARTL